MIIDEVVVFIPIANRPLLDIVDGLGIVADNSAHSLLKGVTASEISWQDQADLRYVVAERDQ